MFNKKRIVVFTVFLFCLFFLMTFAGESRNENVATRLVEFIDGYDNSTISSMRVEVGTSAIVPNDPTHINHVFAGWYLYEDQDQRVTDFSDIRTNLTVIAKYDGDLNNNGLADSTERMYVVTFYDTVLDQTIQTIEVLPGLTVTAPQAPTHDGYTFVGWDQDYIHITSDLTVSTVYTRNAVETNRPNENNTPNNNPNDEEEIRYYTIIFIDGDTNQEIGREIVQEGLSANTPVAPTHENRTFLRWEGTYTNVVANATIVAVYGNDENENHVLDEIEPHYTVTFAKEGKGTLEGTLTYANILTGFTLEKANVIVPTPKADMYYQFAGWEPSNPTPETVVTNQLTYTAKFVPIHDENNNGIADEEEIYQLTISYSSPEKTMGLENYQGEYYYTQEYRIVTPQVENYIPVVEEYREAVMGTMPDHDLFITVVYQPIHDENQNGIADEEEIFTLTIRYANTKGEVMSEEYQEEVLFHAEYMVESPVIANYVASIPTVTGTMPDHDVVIDVVYTPEHDRNQNEIPDEVEETYTITFTSEGKGTLEGTLTYEVLTGLTFQEGGVVVPNPVANLYYTFEKWLPEEVNLNTKVEKDYTYTAVFQPIHDENQNGIADEEEIYHLTIHYVYETGKQASSDYQEEISYNSTYTVNSPEMEYYHADQTVVTGTMPEHDEEVTVTYIPNHDENHNGIADEEESYYHVTFVAEGKGTLEGTLTYEVLTGLTFQEANIVVPTAKPMNEYYEFTGWMPTPSEEMVVNQDLVLKAIFQPIHDENQNGIADEEELYMLTIDYVYSRGGQASATYTGKVAYHSLYSVTSPEIEYYTASLSVVSGMMPEEDVYLKVVYTPVHDANNNGVADEEEEHDTVTFEALAHGTLEGTLTYQDVLTGLSLEDAHIIVPTPKADMYYQFAGWKPSEPTNETVVTSNLVYQAEFTPVHDENNNGIADEEELYTLTIHYVYARGEEASSDYQEEVSYHSTYTVDSPVIEYYHADQTVVTGTMPENNVEVTVTYIPDHDVNENGIADEVDTKYQITFEALEHGTLEGTTEFSVLTGLPFGENVTVPTPVAEDGYVFQTWMPVLPEESSKIESNATYQAVFKEDSNQNGIADEKEEKHTVTFQDYDGHVLKTEEVLDHLSATAPEVPEREGYTFTGWDVEFKDVTTNLVVTAQYEAEVIGMRVEPKANAQLQFQVNSEDDIKNYLNVYRVYADGHEELVDANEYTTDFSTDKVVEDQTLTVTLDEYQDTSLTYDITERPAYPTKFEVTYNPDKSYRKTKNSTCKTNCDTLEQTKAVTTDYTFLEIVEHYDETIQVESVTVNYTDGSSATLKLSDSIRWTHKENNNTYDPVYLATRTEGGNSWFNRGKTVDVMNEELVISTLEITYSRAGYGEFTITFEYRPDTQEFVAVSEVQK